MAVFIILSAEDIITLHPKCMVKLQALWLEVVGMGKEFCNISKHNAWVTAHYSIYILLCFRTCSDTNEATTVCQ